MPAIHTPPPAYVPFMRNMTWWYWYWWQRRCLLAWCS